MTFFAGLDGAKGPEDLGINALMGARVAVNWALPIWEEIGLPRIVPQSPWHGYQLGDWDEEYTVFADAAVVGDWRKSGENTFARRRGNLKPETPVHVVDGKKK